MSANHIDEKALVDSIIQTIGHLNELMAKAERVDIDVDIIVRDVTKLGSGTLSHLVTARLAKRLS